MKPQRSSLGPFGVLTSALRGRRGALLAAVLAATGAQMIGIPLPLLARSVIRSMSETDVSAASMGVFSDNRALLVFAGVALVLVAVHGLLRWLEGALGAFVAQHAIADIRTRMYAHVQRLSEGYFDRRPTGRILIRFVGDANALQNWLSRVCVTVPADVLTLAGVAAAIAVIQPQLLAAAVAPMVLVLPLVLWINPRSRRWTREGRRQQSHLCGHLADRVGAMRVIKAFNAQNADRAEAERLIGGVAAANVRRARLDAANEALVVAGSTAALALITIWGAILLSRNALAHADLLAALWLALLARAPLGRLARANVIHQRARVAVERIQALLSREPEHGWSPGLRPYAGPGRTIELKRVGYQTSDGQWLLRRLSATFTGPGLVVVAGDGARGRSVLFELLLRLRRPHEGRIYLDGEDVRRLRVSDIRRRIGWVDSDALSATLFPPAGNGVAPNATAMPRAERMTLALERALAADPPIVLLDDPTAGLEPLRADALAERIGALSREKLVLVATHDPRFDEHAVQRLTLAEAGFLKTASPSRFTRNAFTLVELLIVIAIISLLMGILLPAINKARAQTRAAVCETRLRSIGQAWTMYAGDNADRIVPGRLPTFVTGGFGNPSNYYAVGTGLKYRPRWPVLLQRYVGTPALSRPSVHSDRQDYESPAYVCPDVPDWTDERNAAYGYNYQFLGNQRLTRRNLVRLPAAPIGRIPDVAITVAAGDSQGSAGAFRISDRLSYSNDGREEPALGNYGWALDPPRLTRGASRAGGSGSRRSAPDPRHANRANMLFCDGHVAPYTLAALGYIVLGDGRVLDTGPGADNRLFSGTGHDTDPP